MNRNPAVLLLVALFLSGCGAEAVPRSPLVDSTAPVREGLIAVVHAGFGEADTELFGGVGSAGTTMDLLLLDHRVYGGSFALVVSGEDAGGTLDAWVESGVFSVDEDVPDTLVFDLLGATETPIPTAFPGGEGFPPREQRLRRFEKGGRIALVPTIDLRSEAFAMAEAHELELSDGELAFFLSGPALADLVSVTIPKTSPSMPPMARNIAGPAAAMRTAVDLLRQLERLVLRVRMGGAELESLSGRLVARSETPLADLMNATRPFAGEGPAGQAVTTTLALDVEELVRAVRGLTDSAPVDELCEALWNFWDGRLVLTDESIYLGLESEKDAARAVDDFNDLVLFDDLGLWWRADNTWLAIDAHETGEADEAPVGHRSLTVGDACGSVWIEGVPAATLRRIPNGLVLESVAQP